LGARGINWDFAISAILVVIGLILFCTGWADGGLVAWLKGHEMGKVEGSVLVADALHSIAAGIIFFVIGVSGVIVSSLASRRGNRRR
jgi:hypothetical protein